MSDQLTVTITGKDGLSKVFQEVTRSADKMVDSLEQAGTSGGKGLDGLGKGAKQAGTGLQAAGKDADGFGKSINTFQQEAESAAANLKGLADAFNFVSDAGTENQRLTDAIGRAYGDAAGELQEFADHLQDTTRFSDEAAESAALYGISLKNNYQIGADSIQQLLERSADLAQINGIELPDAMSRLTSAIRGEGEAAELLGLNMSETAVSAAALKAGLTNWNATGANAMTDAEKAAFRLQVALEQSTFAVGAAAAATGTASGKIAQLSNTFQDVVVSASGMLGPLPAVGGALANVASESFTVLGGGKALIDMFSKAGQGAKSLAIDFAQTSKGAKTTSAAMSLLTAAISPVGLAVGAVAIAGGLLIKSYLDQKKASEDYKISIVGLEEELETLRRQGDTALAGQAQTFTEVIGKVNDLTVATKYLNDAQGEADPLLTGVFNVDPAAEAAFQAQVDALDKLQDKAGLTTDVVNKMNDALTDPNIDAAAYVEWATNLLVAAQATEDLTDDVTALETINQRPLSEFSRHTTETASTVGKAADDIVASFEDIEAVTDDVSKQILELNFEGMEQQAKDVQTLGNAFDTLASTGGKWITVNDEATGAMEQLWVQSDLTGKALEEASFAYEKINAAIASGDYDNARLLKDLLSDLANAKTPEEASAIWLEHANSLDEYAVAADKAGLGSKRLAANLADVTHASEGATAQSEKLAEKTQQIHDAQKEWLANGDNILGFLSEFAVHTDQLGTSADTTVMRASKLPPALYAFTNGLIAVSDSSQTAAASIDTFGQSFDIASQIDAAGDALDRVLGYFTMIDSIGSRSEGANSIASSLMTPDDLTNLTILDQLLADTVIGTTAYTDAVAAGTSIQQDNLAIQEDLNKIRADQLPLLAEQESAYAAQVDALSKLGPAEQRHALLLQDSAFQTKVAEQYSTAYKASLGEIPPDVATEMILESANADQDLKDMLLNLGLLTEKDGVISVSLPDGPTVQDTIMGLTDSIDALNDTLIKITITGDDQFTPLIDDIITPELPDVIVPIEAEDNVTPVTNALETKAIEIPVTFSYGPGPRHEGSSAPGLENSTVTITTELQDNATAPLQDLESYFRGLDGDRVTMEVLGENGDALSTFRESERSHQNLDGNRVTMVVLGNNNDALSSFREEDRAHANLAGQVSTMVVRGDNSNALDAIRRIQAYDGDRLATSYYDIVTRYSTIGSPAGGHGPNRHGGVVGFAHGGLVMSELAEAGPELLHFADGGIVPVMNRGMYGVPAGTYVSPAPSSASAIAGMGGGDIHVHVYGNVYSVDDLAAQVSAKIGPAIDDVFADHARGMGAPA